MLALRTLLSRVAMPAFEIPRERDYGIDVVAFVTAHRHGAIQGLEGETPWVQREAGEIRAIWSDTRPTAVEVPARFVGFQVKTSSKFTPEQEVWRVHIDEKNLRHWRNADFPIVVVASDSEGNLRHIEVDAVGTESQSQMLALSAPFGPTEANRLRRKVLVMAAQDMGHKQSLDVLDPDPTIQAKGVRACWTVFGQQQSMRLLIRCLPTLDIDAREDAVELLSTLLDRLGDILREIDAQVEDLAEARAQRATLVSSVGLDEFDRLGRDAWRSVAVLWQSKHFVTVSSRMFPIGDGARGGWHAVPHDPWPQLTGDVFDLARKRYNQFRVPTLWNAVVDLLFLTPDPLGLVIDFALADLAAPFAKTNCDHTSRGTWWGSLIGKLAAEVEYRFAEPATMSPSAAVRNALSEFLRRSPTLQDDADFMQLVRAYNDL